MTRHRHTSAFGLLISAGRPFAAGPLLSLFCATLLALVGVPVLACEGDPGPGPFAVVGWVSDESGKPVSDLTLILVPLTSGTGEPDTENGVYRVPERDDHQTKTNVDGLFVMPGVYDLKETDTHRFQILHADPARYPDRSPFIYLEGGTVDLADLEPDMVKTRLVARPAGGVRITLRDAAGQPYTGTRAVLITSPAQTFVYTARFESGVHTRPGIAPGQAMVSLLDGELAYFIQKDAHERKKPLAEYVLRQDGRDFTATVGIRAGEYTDVAFDLPRPL